MRPFALMMPVDGLYSALRQKRFGSTTQRRGDAMNGAEGSPKRYDDDHGKKAGGG